MTLISPDARMLATLGVDARPSIFHLLAKADETGPRVSDTGDHLGLAPTTQAHHLPRLPGAGRRMQDRNRREVYDRGDYPAMRRIVTFPVSECYTGVAVPAAIGVGPARFDRSQAGQSAVFAVVDQLKAAPGVVASIAIAASAGPAGAGPAFRLWLVL